MERPTQRVVDLCLKHADKDNFQVRVTAVDNHGAEYGASIDLARVLAAEVRALREELSTRDERELELRGIAEGYELEAHGLREAYRTPPEGMKVRDAARQRYALGGADAQALEGALQQVERECDKLRATIARVEALISNPRNVHSHGIDDGVMEYVYLGPLRAALRGDR